MINAFNTIIEYKENEWEEFLDRICLLEIFKPVILKYQDKETLKCVIRYILYAYSKDSDKIVIGLEWHENKRKIFDFVMAKPEEELIQDLVLLNSPAVVESANRWMDFQDSDVFKQLQVLKDLRLEMQLSANSKIVKSSGEIDYDQKFKNAEYANKLKSIIRDLEQELIQNSKELKKGVQEVRSSRKNSDTFGPENFAK